MDSKLVFMIKGLVYAAELSEQRGQSYDEVRNALAIAREHGWGNGSEGALPAHLPPEEPATFGRQLERLLNVNSIENGSNTPDFILASYLQQCLDTWNLHTKERDRWYGNRSILGPGSDMPMVDTSEVSLLSNCKVSD